MPNQLAKGVRRYVHSVAIWINWAMNPKGIEQWMQQQSLKQ
jgi:hypothetical protein